MKLKPEIKQFIKDNLHLIDTDDWDTFWGLVKEEEGITQGVVRDIIFKGVHYEINVDSEIGITFLVQTTQHFAVGTKVGIRVAPDNIQIMHKPESDDEMVIDKDKQVQWVPV